MRVVLVVCALAAAALVPLGGASAVTLPDRPAGAPPDPGRTFREPAGADMWGASFAAAPAGPGAVTPYPPAAPASAPSTPRPTAQSGVQAGAQVGVQAGARAGAQAGAQAGSQAGAQADAPGSAAARGAAFELARRALPGAAEAARTAARPAPHAPHLSLFHVRPAPFPAPAPIPAALRLGRMEATELAAVGLFGALLLSGAVGLVVLPVPGAGRGTVRHRPGRLVRGAAGVARRIWRAVHRYARRGRRTSYLRPRTAPRPAAHRPRRETAGLVRPCPAAAERLVHRRTPAGTAAGASDGVSVARVRVRRIARRRRRAPGAA